MIPSPWLPEFGETAADVNFLTNCRAMLEPILEETSEEEDNNQELWSQYESVWSSESDTGSVIRVDLNQENDCTSEREYACPPKRRKHEPDDLQDETIFQRNQLQQQQQQQQQQPHHQQQQQHQQNNQQQIQLLQQQQQQQQQNNQQMRKNKFDYVDTKLDVPDYFGKRHDLRLRLDEFGPSDFYSDSDSLSFASLSRSSSLIQFESLEKQLQNDTTSFGSSPSLYSQVSLDSVDNILKDDLKKNLTYNDDNNIIIDKENIKIQRNNFNLSNTNTLPSLLIQHGPIRTQHNGPEIKINFINGLSDSSSDTDSSSYSSNMSVSRDMIETTNRRINLTTRVSNETIKNSNNNNNHNNNNNNTSCVKIVKNKNSVESLSEDSGYCENFSYLLRTKSKSIPCFKRRKYNHDIMENDNDNFLYNNNSKSLENLFTQHYSSSYSDVKNSSKENKIYLASCLMSSTLIPTKKSTTMQIIKQNKNIITSPPVTSNNPNINDTKNSLLMKNLNKQIPHHKIISASSPELHLEIDHFLFDLDPDVLIKNKNNYLIKSNSNSINKLYKDFSIVSSVPDNLNICGNFGGDNNVNVSNSDLSVKFIGKEKKVQEENFNEEEEVVEEDEDNDDDDDDADEEEEEENYNNFNGFDDWNSNYRNNFYDFDRGCASKPSLTMSYANLTLLGDGDDDSDNFEFGRQRGFRNSFEQTKKKDFNILYEFSANFDRGLSILNDEEESYDPVEKFIDREKAKISRTPPQPPPRKSHSKLMQSDNLAEIKQQQELMQQQQQHNKIRATFDQDPTNITTCYAESLERCNFDISTPVRMNSNEYLPNSLNSSSPFVSSTPNLNLYESEKHIMSKNKDDFHFTSMRQIDSTEKPIGIIMTTTTTSSKGNLSKGVSFCPIVSEISWKETNTDHFYDEQYDDQSDHRNNQLDYDDYDDFDDDDEDDDDDDDDDDFTNLNPPTTKIFAVQIPSAFSENLKMATLAPSSSSSPSSSPLTNTNTNSTHCNNVNINNNNNNNNNNLIPIQIHPDYIKNHNINSNTISTVQNTNKQFSTVTTTTTTTQSSPPPTLPRNDDRLTNNTNINEVRSLERDENSCFNVNNTNDTLLMKKRNDLSDSSCSNIGVDCSSTMNTVEIKPLAELNNKKYQHQQQQQQQQQQSIQKHQENLLKNNTMESKSDDNNILDNNNLKKKEKKQKSGGFLSRFSSFRFSLKNKSKKNKTNKNDKETDINNKKDKKDKKEQEASTATTTKITTAAPTTKNNILLNNKKSDSSDVVKSVKHQVINNNNNNNNNINNINNKPIIPQKPQDYVLIPLRGPSTSSTSMRTTISTPQLNELKVVEEEIDGNNMEHKDHHQQQQQQHNYNHELNLNKNFNEIQQQNINSLSTFNNNNNNSNINNINNHVLITKPPLPKLPPRVVGVSTKRMSPAYPPRASSLPREINDDQRKYRITNLNNNNNINNNNNKYLMNGENGDNYDDDIVSNNHYPQHKIGLIETNLDTHETIVTGKTRSLMELVPEMNSENYQNHTGLHHKHHHDEHNNIIKIVNGITSVQPRRPHKSMEFLLDKENQKNVLPPENELQKSHESNTLSEHQLRVQASLQRLNIPDWFKQYNSTTQKTPDGAYTGNIIRKRSSDLGRWTGLNSKTTSLSSLGSHRSDKSPLMLSPSAHSHHGNTGFSRWSTSHLNSTQTSPSVSTRGSFVRGNLNASTHSGQSVISGGHNNIRSSFRQPYLGWRSQEKLSQPRTPSERLASSLLAKQPINTNTQQQPEETAEIQSSIKEVTSAIVHYVNDQTNRTSRSRSASPNTRKCWLESSFVGIRQIESPQTPVIDKSIHSNNGNIDGARINGVAQIPASTSMSSATLEDVLASLLGLPLEQHRSSTDTTVNENMNDATRLQIEQQILRRRSEGDAQKRELAQQRRVSLDSGESKTELMKCRYPKCDSAANPNDAKKFYKSCHNCSNMYCSRECRREHWEKHRKQCLHSRVSSLCRQVLSTCKDDSDTLRHLSLLARKGYLSQGRGLVRILFRSPESADIFIKQGFQCIGESSYVRWPDLLPAEMGPELYSELLRLSIEYKPESKMLIYVAICVISEAPGGTTGTVKWERQLVSRCAKLKICKSIVNETIHQQITQPEQNTDILILTFNSVNNKKNQKKREFIFRNIQNILKERGVNLRKHFPDVFHRLNAYVDGTTDRFLPVTVHPRETNTITGKTFICIIMANNGDMENIKMPTSDCGNRVQTIDVSLEK